MKDLTRQARAFDTSESKLFLQGSQLHLKYRILPVQEKLKLQAWVSEASEFKIFCTGLSHISIPNNLLSKRELKLQVSGLETFEAPEVKPFCTGPSYTSISFTT